MARYYEGVNGSMQGTAGGVNVYNWRGVWLQRARRKEVMQFVPTAKQAIVLQNFSALSRFLKPFGEAFKKCIPNPPAGQTYRSLASKYNYRIQRNADPSSAVIAYTPSLLQLGIGNLGAQPISIESPRQGEWTISWSAPATTSPLFGAEVVVVFATNPVSDPTDISVTTHVFDASAGSATIDITSLGTNIDTEVYACFVTADGSTRTIEMGG